ncbi:hypothetical protein Q5425_33590 [Amycolatopsis sp. A133]|uniref:hypothetical protein n=1 Tax=Amycolatopsis sp. A133 TaxID=3064472 RepID=UPI0027F07742|nr:hypothetical protein [Amycolatopsis sp. A133]MDQ7808694.1 hypothetical protein [Amycolatopsis sp. A133]
MKMRKDTTAGEFDATPAGSAVDSPLGDATPEAGAARPKIGVRAGILAGLTLGVAGAAVVTMDISTVVSNHTHA